MTKAPKKTDSRAKALAGMTKPELVKTIKALDRKQTTLLNRIAHLENQLGNAFNNAREPTQPAYEKPTPAKMPWDCLPNPYEGGTDGTK